MGFIKSLCTAGETVTTNKTKHEEWERVFASYSSDQGLTPRTQEEIKIERQRTI
jgi:hypothetical protein